MDKILITGGKPLYGTVHIGGAKNAALPILAAALLTEEEFTLTNIPFLSDITTMAHLLVSLGVSLNMHTVGAREPGRTITLRADRIPNPTAVYDIVRKMRASVVVLGPLVARFGEARVSLPGGCAIGARPIDFHLMALEKLGAEVQLEQGYVNVQVPGGRLKGADITFPHVSVGATENIMMAAALADGTTILRNAAAEPEVSDLAQCLNQMGANISGIGTHTLTIEGVKRLHGTQYHVMHDRIEAGTYAIAAAMAGGEVHLDAAPVFAMGATIDAMKRAGIDVRVTETGLTVKHTPGTPILSLSLTTAPHPDFPTDMQAQFTALLCMAQGESTITETIFENRFMHVPELTRMGARIDIHGNRIVIHGGAPLQAAEVMATDLRASVCLVLAALTNPGTTHLNRIYHLDRGYERLEEKLQALGADVKRVRA